MSDTLDNVETRIRAQIHDVATDPVVSPETMIVEINNALLDLATEGLVGKVWTDSWIALIANTYTYNLATTSSAEYGAILSVRRHSDGMILNKRSPQILEAMYRRNPIDVGRPDDYALIESTGQVMQMRVGPCPAAGDLPESLDVMFEQIPGRVAQGTDTIGLSRNGLAALENLAASYICASLNQDALDKLRLPPTAAQTFAGRAENAKHNELSRVVGYQLPNEIQQTEA